MKLHIGGIGSCGTHPEKETVSLLASIKEIEIVKDFREADLIILMDTCCNNYQNLNLTLNTIDYINNNKSPNSRLIVSGCIAQKFKDPFNETITKLLADVEVITYQDIVPFILKLFSLEEFQEEFIIPYNLLNGIINISPVQGCPNKCSFCKTRYLDFKVQSYPMSSLASFKKIIQDINTSYSAIAPCIEIFSSNMSVYGTDLYHHPLAHKAIKLLTGAETIKYATIGCLINFYPELLKEIYENEKIQSLSISLETGSPKLYSEMNRPISLDKLIAIIKSIKEKRPDIVIQSDIIAGFNGETIDDIKRTIDLVEELGVLVPFTFALEDIGFKMSDLKDHSNSYRQQSRRIYVEHFNKTNHPIFESIYNENPTIVNKVDGKCYCILFPKGYVRRIPIEEIGPDYQLNDEVDNKVLSLTRKHKWVQEYTK